MRHLLGLDTNVGVGTKSLGRELAWVDLAVVENVRHRIVRHVDGRIAQTLNEELGVPREVGTQAIRTRACPLFEPANLFRGAIWSIHISLDRTIERTKNIATRSTLSRTVYLNLARVSSEYVSRFAKALRIP